MLVLMVATMAKMARVARRENLAKIGMRNFLNNFVVLYEQCLPKKRRAHGA
jgi:ethanolamine ammonia-lyase large subunit